MPRTARSPRSRRPVLAATAALSLAGLTALAAGASADPVSDLSDRSAPTTTASVSAPDGSAGWHRAGATVTLSAADEQGGSGLDRTEYRLDGGNWLRYGEEAILDDTQASFAKWKQAPSGQFVRLPDGSVVSNGGLGMLWYPVRAYGDVAIKLQFRDLRPDTGFANSGVFVRFPNPDEAVARPAADRYPCQVGSGQTSPAWAAIYCGQEIQIYDGTTGEVQKTGSVYNFSPLPIEESGATAKATWSDYEIRTEGGGDYKVTVIRNGQVLQTWRNTPGQRSSRGGDPGTELRQFAQGYIGLQNHSNQDAVNIRNVRVVQLGDKAIHLDGVGRHLVEYRSVDKAGNTEATRSTTVLVDGAAPTTSAAIAAAGPGAAKVTLTADDGAGSGKGRTEYRLDGGAWRTYEAPEVPILDSTASSFATWKQAPAGSFERQADGSVLTRGGLGMLWYPTKQYGDVAFKMQFREARTDGGYSNSGVFVRFPDPGETTQPGKYACEPAGRPAWVAIGCGQEIQIYDGTTGEVQKTGSIYNLKPLSLEQARPSARGAWNDYEVRTTGGGTYTVTVIRNGEVLNEYVNTPGQQTSRLGDPPTDLRQYATGYVGLQNHSDADLTQFRDVRVQSLVPADSVFTVSGAGQHVLEFRTTDVAGNTEQARSTSFTVS